MATRRPHHPSTTRGRMRGTNRKQLSQNFLHDRRAARAVCDELRGSSLPVIELGAGSGAITAELVNRGHAVTAVELDPRWARTLRSRSGAAVDVVQADMLRFRLPDEPYNVVSSVPYAITTAVLRRLLSDDGCRTAAVLVQWEVARKRSGPNLLTANWWPWYELTLVRRMPASAFRPVPSVDSGILRISRRPDPLLSPDSRRAYQHFVESVFTGRGGGLAGILSRRLPRARVHHWMRENYVDPTALPRDLTAQQWASLFRLTLR